MTALLSTAVSFARPSIRRGRTGAPFALAGACLVLFATSTPVGAQDLIRGQPEDTPEAVDPGGKDWTFVLGGGVRVGPSYQGSDKVSVSPLPFVAIDWRDRVFLDMERGIGVNVVRSGALKLGVSVGLAPGRNEDDEDHLKGLGDIDTAARGHVFGSYSFGMLQLGIDLSKDFGGSDGLQVRPSVSVQVPLSATWKLTSGVSATWADDDTMQTFFGVSTAQSRSSGLERFDAGAGFKSVDFRVGLNWAISESWFATANVGVGVLLGDAADSPITESRVQPSVALAVGYRF
ncbi:outer membrane scaffolding protein for murein synthesis (MipA/OmpV family) [Inquilinus ginsengisoli]|uniref:Outer membrane scaffolding protein for murein synthesis (MipA/OmpV family) n=1 Tax=Inquilinus ginsengisoli TaxID=363840 RepID=A0ABU1JKJ6_9PROT|nr:MipA/OmpV family protein [Inquilinus ginsengisoli]MDR6289134.1 outer membrane scaffolding protein for murein synthesis (MipA/OmpV family) [Inquilinus ginsengisoli]